MLLDTVAPKSRHSLSVLQSMEELSCSSWWTAASIQTVTWHPSALVFPMQIRQLTSWPIIRLSHTSYSFCRVYSMMTLSRSKCSTSFLLTTKGGGALGGIDGSYIMIQKYEESILVMWSGMIMPWPVEVIDDTFILVVQSSNFLHQVMVLIFQFPILP